MNTLIFGYGNADRQDDGIAWHVLHELMRRNNLPVSDDLDIDYQDELNHTDYRFNLQLMPELADELDHYDRVCFIDAHTGAVPEDVHFEKVNASFQNSPFTHHLTAASLLSITETIHHKTPETILVSIRGYEFGFSRELSNKTKTLIDSAVTTIIAWLT